MLKEEQKQLIKLAQEIYLQKGMFEDFKQLEKQVLNSNNAEWSYEFTRDVGRIRY